MKGSEHRFTVLILLSVSLQLSASYRSEIYYAYINNRMDLWRGVIERMDAIHVKSNELLLELVNYQYGYIGYCIEFGKKNEARKYLWMAEKNVAFLEKQKFDLPVINAYKAAFYGFRTKLKPVSTPVNGFRSIECARTALKLDPENYFCYIQYGYMKSNMPPAIGGSIKEALKNYLKGKELIEKNMNNTKGDWNYLSLLVLIAQTYSELKDYTSAKTIYENILKIEPAFIYVRDDLYIKLIKEMGS